MEVTVSRSFRHWWVFVVRGILFTLLGIYIFTSPLSTYLALGFMFGLAILIAGITELLHAYQDHGSANRGWHLFAGIVDLLLGLVLISHLAASMLILRIIVGFYFLFKGVLVFKSRRMGGSQLWMIIGALITLVFVIMIWADPAFGAWTIIISTALAFIVTGILNIMLGLRMRRLS